MGKHYKGTGLCRNSSTIRPTDVKRPILLREMPKSPTRVLSVIQTAVMVASIISFLWYLWRLPQEHTDYPDGFVQCPVSSYKILDDRNVTIKCTTCPECPPGQQPMPLCGSTIFKETTIECTLCSSETYSEEDSSGTCKPCRSCGLRETMSPCTSQKNTQCGECPRGHYQADSTMNSCKKCSSCCTGRSYAELECIYLKHCRRKNCTQKIVSKPIRVPKLYEVIQTLTPPGSVTIQSLAKCHVSVVRNNLETAKILVFDNTAWQARFEGNVARSASTKFQTDDSNASTTPITFDPIEAVTSLSGITKSNSQEGIDTAPKYSVIKATMPLNLSYFGDMKKRQIIIIAIGVFVVLLLAFIAVTISCNFWKRAQSAGQIQENGCMIIKCTCCNKYVVNSDEYRPVLHESAPQTDFDYQEISDNRDSMVDSTSFEKTAYTDCLESLCLTNIPLALEDSLVKKLDVRRKWQKVGTEFGVKRDDLEYLENEHKYNKSPTQELLYILGCQGRTAADLVNVLKSANVNYPDIALLVQRHLTAQTR